MTKFHRSWISHLSQAKTGANNGRPKEQSSGGRHALSSYCRYQHPQEMPQLSQVVHAPETLAQTLVCLSWNHTANSTLYCQSLAIYYVTGQSQMTNWRCHDRRYGQ
jgi:hypothetical protein